MVVDLLLKDDQDVQGIQIMKARMPHIGSDGMKVKILGQSKQGHAGHAGGREQNRSGKLRLHFEDTLDPELDQRVEHYDVGDGFISGALK